VRKEPKLRKKSRRKVTIKRGKSPNLGEKQKKGNNPVRNMPELRKKAEER